MEIYENVGEFRSVHIIVYGVLEESYRIFPGKDIRLLAKNKENSFICDVAIFFEDVAVHP